MCVIIHKPADARPSLQTLEACSINNPDGWGIMFVEDGQVVTIKDVDNDKFFQIYKDLQDRELGIHFRWKTHGLIDFENTHPYRVLSPEEHNADLWLMHNGVISIDQKDRSKSDTWHFVNMILQPILSRTGPGLILNPSFQDLVEERIGYGSKLLLLDNENNFVKVNEQAGIDFEGCWLSNSYSHTLNRWSGKESQAKVKNRSYSSYGSYGSYGYGSWFKNDEWDEDPNDPIPFKGHNGTYRVQEGSGGLALLPHLKGAKSDAAKAEAAAEIADLVGGTDTVEEDYRRVEGADYWFPGPQDLAVLPDVLFEDLEHLDHSQLVEFCELRPDVAANLIWEWIR